MLRKRLFRAYGERALRFTIIGIPSGGGDSHRALSSGVLRGSFSDSLAKHETFQVCAGSWEGLLVRRELSSGCFSYPGVGQDCRTFQNRLSSPKSSPP